MLKSIVILGIAILVGLVVYYGRFLVTKKVVEEEIPATVEPNPAAPLPEVAREGTFQEIDFLHRGKGTAKILTDTTGQKLLRLENFEVTNGPDLYVYLSPNPVPRKDKESLGEFINLGRLKGNVGNQNYVIPEGAGMFESAVIWCRQFGVLFSYATLK